ncbi:MAG TPA: hypothetical protein V6C65_04410 [Allocoleopsis sp.]
MATTAKSNSSSINRRNSLNLTYETELGGLYRPELTVTLLDKKVRFIPPAQIQRAIIQQFLILALQDLVSNSKQRLEMTKNELFLKCAEKLALVAQADPQKPSQEAVAVIAALFSNPNANEFLLKVIEQSFPDLQNAHMLTEMALMSASSILFEHLLEQNNNANG